MTHYHSCSIEVEESLILLCSPSTINSLHFTVATKSAVNKKIVSDLVKLK